jgi:hypothetical protein
LLAPGSKAVAIKVIAAVKAAATKVAAAVAVVAIKAVAKVVAVVVVHAEKSVQLPQMQRVTSCPRRSCSLTDAPKW